MSIQIKKKFIKSQVIDGTKVLFLNEDSFKALNSQGQETELFKLSSGDKLVMLQMPQVSSDPVADEDLSRKKYVDDSLEVEMLAREAGDEALSEDLATETAARIAAVSAEEAARIAAVSAEQSAREAADTTLQSNIDAEVARAEAAEFTLSGEIATEAAAREAADIAEATARDAAILVETNARIAADNLLLPLDGSRSMVGDLNMGGFAPGPVDSSEFSGSNLTLYMSPDYQFGDMAKALVIVDIGSTLTGSESLYAPMMGGSFTFDYTILIEGMYEAYMVDGPGFDPNTAVKLGVLRTEPPAFFPELGPVTNYKVIGVADGVDANDAVNKGQLDAAVSGINSDISDTEAALAAEVAAREAEDLTLLKLDGSRAMEGNLSMGSVGGDFVDSAQFIDSVVNPGQRALSLTFTSPLPSSGIYVAVPVGGDVEALITASGPIDYEYGPAFSGDTAKVFENAFPTQPEKDWYFLPDLTGGGSFDYANKIALVTADFSLESVTSLGSGGGNSYKITNLADGVDAGDAVNKGQLDAVAASLGGDIQAALAAEIAAREAADVALQSEVDAVEAALAQEILDRVADVDAEETRALAAEGILQSNIDVEKGRIDAILLASDADKDSFAEIVALINSVDTENDSAFAAYVLSNDAALAQEVSDRISDVNAEETRALAAEGVLQDNIDAEETRALAAEGVLQGNIDTEEAARIAADSALQGELDATQVGAGLGTDGSYTAPAVSNYLGSAVSLKDADSKLDTEIKSVADDLAQEILDRVADVDAEETRALAAEGLLDGRLDILEGDATTEGSVAKAEQDAKDYTDAAIAQEVLDRNAAISTAVSNLVDGAPALLDTLNELAAAINDDENFAATIATQIGGLDSRTDALEAASIEFKAVEKFVLTSTNISNGYVDISYQAIQNSLRVSVDRLAIHQGASNDYTVSVVGGVTRITFVNSLVTPGQEQISVGDEVYVEGAKLAIVTV